MADEPPACWIVDTNVVSREGEEASRPDLGLWLAANAGRIRISVVTLAEMRRGIVLLRERVERLSAVDAFRRERERLKQKVAWYGMLRSRFADRLIPVDAEIAERWADVSVRVPSIRDGDKLILATAFVRGYGIATRNLRDFRSQGVPLVNPFDRATWWDVP